MDTNRQIITLINDFLDRFEFPAPTGVSVEAGTDPDSLQVFLKTAEPGLIIGYHGENLSALQLVLGQHLHSRFDRWLNLSINVNDYRERRESALHSLADSAVTRVIATGQPHSLPPMPAGERRIVHMYLSDHPQVTTSSEGLGRNRSVIISPRAV